MDIEHDIVDTICTSGHLKLYQHVVLNQSKCLVYFALVHLGVLLSFIPQTYLFMELIHCLVLVMYPRKFLVMKNLGENIFLVFSLLIQWSLYYPSASSYVSFLMSL